METFDHIFLGGNIASLVAANELGSRGQRVALVAPPGSIGGHFSSHECLDYRFDLGMLLLEFDSYQNQQQDLNHYDPAILGHAGQFSGIVENYLSQYFDWRPVEQMQVATNGGVINDYYISNYLNELPSVFTSKELEQIRSELQNCIDGSSSVHARNKSTSSDYNTLDFEAASIANHGEVLHRNLIQPLVSRATNIESNQLLAKLHRLFWAPLFYPETLLDTFNDRTTLTPTAFAHPKNAPVSEISRKLIDQVSSHCTVVSSLSELTQKDSTWFVNGEISSKQVASSLPQGMLAKLLGIESSAPERSSYLIVFLKVAGSVDCEVFFNASDKANFFRLVNQSRLRGDDESVTHLCVEYNLDLVGGADGQFVAGEVYLDEIRQFIEHFELGSFELLESAVQMLENKIVFPTLDNVQQAADNASGMNGIDIELLGPSIGMTSSSLNDQILQGLKYAKAH